MENLDLAHALIRFRRELVDMGFSPSERNECLEEFKRWFSRSQDYDLAISRVLERRMIGAYKQQSFKHYWDTNISKDGENEENQAVQVAQRIADEHKGVDWPKIIKKIIISLVVGMGVTMAVALRAASKVKH